jgi:hypothetical protein
MPIQPWLRRDLMVVSDSKWLNSYAGGAEISMEKPHRPRE